MGGDVVLGGALHVGDVARHVGDVAPHVGDVAPHVGDVAPTYDIPVRRGHAPDGFWAPPCTP